MSKPVSTYPNGAMAPDRQPLNGDSDSGIARSSLLLRAVIAYLVIGAALAQGSWLLIRAVGFSPVLLQAVLAILFLGLPVMVVGIMALQGRFGTAAATHALRKSPWTSAPMVLILGAVVLLAGAGGWDMFPGPANQLGFPVGERAALGFLPPRVLSGDPADEVGMGEVSRRVRSSLSGISGLTLLPDSLVDLYRGTSGEDPVATILLRQTFQRGEDGVVLSLEVLDARSGESLWSGRVEGPPGAEPGNLPEQAVRVEMEDLLLFLEGGPGVDPPEVRSP